MSNKIKKIASRIGMVIAGIVIGLFLLQSIDALARVKPTWGDTSAKEQLTGQINSGKITDPSFMSVPRGIGAAVSNWYNHGKFNGKFNPGEQISRIDSSSPNSGKMAESNRYNKQYNTWNSKKHVKVNLNNASGLKKNTAISSIQNDSRLSGKKNSEIKSYIDKNFDKWYKQQKKKKGFVSRAAAQEEVMELTGDAYDHVLGKNNKIAKSVNKDLNKDEKDLEKENKKQDKDTAKSSSEPTSFSGKVAKAFLDLFYSSGIGEWMAKSGAGATIFGINYSEGTSSAKIAEEIEKSYSNNGYNEIYPETAYTKSIQNVGKALGPAFIALSAVLIVITIIIETTKMGVGQVIDPVRSRQEWIASLVESMFAVVGILNYNALLGVILSINGAFVSGFASFMAGTTTASGYNILSEAITLGYSKTTINALTSGTFLGSDFVGIVFSVIYLMTYIGLAVYIKYYYFVREVVFTILWALGPIFIAFWPSNWGKYRTMNWFREMIGTVMIQSIHALTITFLALLMAWNNSNWAEQATEVKTKSAFDAANDSYKAAGKNLTDGSISGAHRLIGAAGNAIKGTLQATGIAGTGTSIVGTGAAGHFETMVIGFIVMVMFQPLSKGLASLFGFQTNMLDEIHQSTSNSLKAAALVSGGVVAGSAALAGSAATGGVSLLSGAKALRSASAAATHAKKGAKTAAFKKAFSKSFNRKTPLNKLRSRVAGINAKLNGFAGKRVGEMLGASVGLGAGDPMAAVAASRLGGEIGERAANITATPLSKLGLKQADPNRSLKKHLKDQLNGITNKATAQSLRNTLDKSAGFDDFIQKAKASKDFKNDKNLQAAVKEAEADKEFAKDIGLDEDQAVEARAARLLRGKNNYKNAKDINDAFTKAVSKLPKAQQAAALQAGHKAMILAGAPANGNIMMDNLGYADTEGVAKDAEKRSRQDSMDKLKKQYNANMLPNTNPKTMSFDEWQKTPQFQEGYKPQIEQKAKMAAQQAAQYALNSSNGYIYGDIDDKKFKESLDNAVDAPVLNSDIFKREAMKGLKKANISDENASTLASSADSVTNGESLTQEVKGLDGNAQILNANLWRKLNAQNAKNVNSTWGGEPVTNGEQLDAIYNGQGMNAYGSIVGDNYSNPTAQDITDKVNDLDSATNYAQSQKNWADFHNATQSAAENGDPLQFGTWFGNNGIFHPINDSMFGTGTDGINMGGFGGYSKGSNLNGHVPTQWDAVAQDRMTSNPYLKPDISGMSLSQAFNMMPKVMDSHNKPIGVRPGSFRMAIGNTHSLLQAQDESGNWYNVGKLGRGDGTLRYGDTVFQDLDLVPNGTPSVAYDAASHSVVQPYRYQNGQKVTASLPNGTPPLESFFDNANFSTVAKRIPGDFAHLPKSQILQKAADWNTQPTVDQYKDYSDIALQGDKVTFVITGKNPYTGVREALSAETTDNPTLSSLPDQTTFSIPLKSNNLTGYDIDTSKNYELFFNGNLRQTEKDQAKELLSDFYNDSHQLNETNKFLHDSMMPYTKPDMNNFIGNNPGFESGTNLDTFSQNN